VSKTVKNSHLLKKETTWDLNTLTGQLVAQLVYCTSSLIESRDEKHVEEILKLITVYKKRVKKYKLSTFINNVNKELFTKKFFINEKDAQEHIKKQ